jgi:hypothetical protein
LPHWGADGKSNALTWEKISVLPLTEATATQIKSSALNATQIQIITAATNLYGPLVSGAASLLMLPRPTLFIRSMLLIVGFPWSELDALAAHEAPDEDDAYCDKK